MSKKAWVFRGITLLGIAAFMIYTIGLALSVGDPLIVYSTLMPVHAIGLLTVGWIFFRNKATGRVPDDLVSVIIPVYNQEDLIEKVVNAVFRSTYPRVEVIAVNDGSRDKTAEVLDRLAKKKPQLKVIHKPNAGKRSAVAAGFNAARGDFMVLMDSDSIVDKRAIEEFMKVFSGNPKVGGLVAHGKVLNSTENLLTKCQDVWYDFCFNINKSTESAFGSVLCLSGCMAAYRREAIAEFMTFWAQDKFRFGDDRHLTAYVMATPWAKSELARLQKHLLKSMANYDDAEDRGLTSQAVAKAWETVYVPTAIVYTDVPRTLRKYIRQQTRWRKGYLRSTFFMSAFFWRKHPVLAFLFYMDFMSALITPAVIFSIFIYGPIFLHSYLFPFTYLGGQLLIGLVIGLDYRLRDPTAKQWVYKPIMNLISALVLPWLLFPAILGFKRNGWLTR